jgi:membrane-associated phospholipid phosphatase
MADAVTHWNDVLLKVIRRLHGDAAGPTQVSRGGAMMHGAIYDAVNSIEPSTHRPYLVSVPSVPGTSVRAAIAHAAHDTLVVAFPSQSALITAERNAEIAAIPPSADVTRGEVVGKAAARAMITARANDGANIPMPYTPGGQPGDWRPTNSGPPVGANWPDVTPFGIPAGNAFRPPLPGGYASKSQVLSSSEYTANFNEVKRVGRFDALATGNRTAEQEEIAKFWANDLDGTYKPPGQLFDITKRISNQKGLDLVDNARLFALVALAMGDAAIVAWDAKFATPLDLWRPETAIRLAGPDGNPATAPDPNWKPLSFDPSTGSPTSGMHFSPPFPAYVSGHATFGGAFAGVMRGFFGTDVVMFTAGTEDPNLPNPSAVTRTYKSFTEMAIEEARSRVYLGVHFDFDGVEGRLAGTAAGKYIYDHVLRPIGA